MTPQDHNRTLGITHLCYGGFHLLMMLLFTAIFTLVLAVPHRGNSDISVFAIMMTVMIAFSLLFTLPSLIAGFALLKRKSWARTAAIVAGILATPSFPYGTALGVYTLWFMFGEQGKNFYAEVASGNWQPGRYGALPGQPAASNWATGGPYNEHQREREYVPPPRMPDWRG